MGVTSNQTRPTERTTMISTRRATGAAAGFAALALLVTACGGEGEAAPSPEPAPTTSPELTAPEPEPTPEPEDVAAEEITEQFEDSIAALDGLYQNASDYADQVSTPGWQEPVVEDQARMEYEARELFMGSTALYVSGERDQIGEREIVGFEITDLETDGETGNATTEACIDQSELEFVDFAGEPLEVDEEVPNAQLWTTTWEQFNGGVAGDGGQTLEGWWITSVSGTFQDEPC